MQRERVVSVDALRGFDMFWIIGADAVVAGLRPLNSSPWIQGLADQLEHVEWEGFRFYDLIFPLFVFLVGLSSVFSLGRIREQRGLRAAYGRLFRRAAVIYLLGLFYYGGLSRDGGPEQFRYVGVLQRLAITYLFGGLIFLNFRMRGIFVSLVVLLVGYWLLMGWTPVPGVGVGRYEPGANLAHWIDQHYLPGYKWDGQWDPEGLLSHIPAVASALLGVLAGLVLQMDGVSRSTRARWFVLAGCGCLVLGVLWGQEFPIIKKIWTSSYVLVAGGWSFLLLALFYTVIDIWQLRAWAQPFVWIGMNPITIYMVVNFIDPRTLVRQVVHDGLLARMDPYGELFVSAAGLALAVAFCYWLYRRGIFLRV